MPAPSRLAPNPAWRSRTEVASRSGCCSAAPSDRLLQSVSGTETRPGFARPAGPDTARSAPPTVAVAPRFAAAGAGTAASPAPLSLAANAPCACEALGAKVKSRIMITLSNRVSCRSLPSLPPSDGNARCPRYYAGQDERARKMAQIGSRAQQSATEAGIFASGYRQCRAGDERGGLGCQEEEW